MVFAPSPVSPRQAATVFAQIPNGEGYVGCLGDVNGEPETTITVLAMVEFAARRAGCTVSSTTSSIARHEPMVLSHDIPANATQPRISSTYSNPTAAPSDPSRGQFTFNPFATPYVPSADP